MQYIEQYIDNITKLISILDKNKIDELVELLKYVQLTHGRLYILGVGGSAANASHAVNDFRKICGIQAYTPTDNVAELTAYTNDKGWANTFMYWLEEEGLNYNDLIMILSVGGGTLDASPNIMKALTYAKNRSVKVCGIIGRDGGHTKYIADTYILIPTIDDKMITPFVESLQSVILHLVVNHPMLAKDNVYFRYGRW